MSSSDRQASAGTGKSAGQTRQMAPAAATATGATTATGTAASGSAVAGTAASGTVTPGKRQGVKRVVPNRAGTPAARAAAGAPRRVRLVVSRLDPWSAMKLSFLLSVAAGVVLVICLAVLWSVLNGMGVFDQVNELIAQIVGNEKINVLDYVGLSKVLSLGTVLAVVNVALLTALGTLGAFLYNICSALVGGMTTTLTDD